MQHLPVDNGRVEMSTTSDVEGIERALQSLWDSTNRAIDTISHLRGEKQQLAERVVELERRLSGLENELQKLKEQAAARKKGVELSFNGDREALAARVRDLLAKIDSYL